MAHIPMEYSNSPSERCEYHQQWDLPIEITPSHGGLPGPHPRLSDWSASRRGANARAPSASSRLVEPPVANKKLDGIWMEFYWDFFWGNITGLISDLAGKRWHFAIENG